jgi:hypothetical protein
LELTADSWKLKRTGKTGSTGITAQTDYGQAENRGWRSDVGLRIAECGLWEINIFDAR